MSWSRAGNSGACGSSSLVEYNEDQDDDDDVADNNAIYWELLSSVEEGRSQVPFGETLNEVSQS